MKLKAKYRQTGCLRCGFKRAPSGGDNPDNCQRCNKGANWLGKNAPKGVGEGR